MRIWSALMTLVLLAGCATAPTAPIARQSDTVFQDQLFALPTETYVASDLFQLDEAMKRYISTDIATELRQKGGQLGLFDALYGKNQLQLEYDATMTRTASQAFQARSGNCLSLVILTAAFAKELGIRVRYQLVYVDDVWSRGNGLDFFDAHVNVTLGARELVGKVGLADPKEMTVDFLPPRNLGTLRTRVLSEQTIVSMYMNNRAAELLAQRELDRAYWWARAAIKQDSRYIPAYNTLGVIYKWHGNLREAEQVFSQILAIEPENAIAMSNLVPLFNDLGRTAEAKTLAARLKTIRPFPPFHYFDMGVEAMRSQNFKLARAMFEKQLQRDASNDQSHFWLALAFYNLGDAENALKHMAIAVDTSTTKRNRELYEAKLGKLSVH